MEMNVERHKIDNFLREYPGQQFPPVRKLSDEECSSIKAGLMQQFGYTGSIEGLLDIFWRDENRCGNVEKEGVSFIRNLLNKNTKEHSVFIDWCKFDDIDEIAIDDFIRYFDDIWYPGADDIDVFDRSYSWVMRVSHWADIFVTRPEQR